MVVVFSGYFICLVNNAYFERKLNAHTQVYSLYVCIDIDLMYKDKLIAYICIN